jgi:hypothetical protein
MSGRKGIRNMSRLQIDNDTVPHDSVVLVVLQQKVCLRGISVSRKRIAVNAIREVAVLYRRERVGHIAIEAHGAVPEFTKDQTRRQHEQGAFESKGRAPASGPWSTAVPHSAVTSRQNRSGSLRRIVSSRHEVGSCEEGERTTSESKGQGSLALSYRPVFPRLRSGSHSKQLPL